MANQDVEIACTLTESEADVRVQDWIDLQGLIRATEEIADGARNAVRSHGWARVRRSGRSHEPRGSAAPFLTLHVARDGDDLCLDITGPPGAAQEVIANLAGT